MSNTPIAHTAEKRVQAVAYALWLEEGCPEGRAEDHWYKALDRVNAEAIVPPAKRKAPVRKKTAK